MSLPPPERTKVDARERAYIVFVTASNADEAARIARACVAEGLAACGNIIPGLRSIYAWKGEIHDDAEVLLLLKTRGDLLDALQAAVMAAHSYEVAEFLAVPVAAGSPAYLQWLRDVTRASA